MKVIETKIPGVLIVETDVFGDHRGYFTETYSKPKYEKLGITVDFVKDNMLAFFVAVGLFVLSIISIILVLLQKARKAEAVAKLAAGMNGHIAKPIQVDKLLSTLKTILTENIIL